MSENTVREACREAFEADQFADMVPDAAANERDGDGYRYLVVDSNWRQWQAAWTASRKQAMEEAAQLAESDEFYGNATQHAIAAAIRQQAIPLEK